MDYLHDGMKGLMMETQKNKWLIMLDVNGTISWLGEHDDYTEAVANMNDWMNKRAEEHSDDEVWGWIVPSYASRFQDVH